MLLLLSFGVDIYIYIYIYIHLLPPWKVYHISHTIHVWYIYLHLVDFYGKCRQIYHAWILWVYTYMFLLIHSDTHIYWDAPPLPGYPGFHSDDSKLESGWRGWVHIPKMYAWMCRPGSEWINGLFHLATWKGKSSEPNLHELGFKMFIFQGV